jgi:hypothetical protein
VKLLALLVVSVSLVLGLAGAMTAYSPPLALPDAQLLGLTLNAPAGLSRSPSGAAAPLANKGRQLNAELLAALRSSGESRVRVKEFAFSRWTGSVWFLVGCLGLGGGAWLIRRQTRQALEHARAAPAAGATAESAIDAIRQSVDRLRSALPTLSDEPGKLRRILDELTPVQEVHVPAFAAARSLLISRLGMSGYARLMDRFAAGERQINRAWAAAADGYLDESLECLAAAEVLLEDARQRLQA